MHRWDGFHAQMGAALSSPPPGPSPAGRWPLPPPGMGPGFTGRPRPAWVGQADERAPTQWAVCCSEDPDRPGPGGCSAADLKLPEPPPSLRTELLVPAWPGPGPGRHPVQCSVLMASGSGSPEPRECGQRNSAWGTGIRPHPRSPTPRGLPQPPGLVGACVWGRRGPGHLGRPWR